MQFKGAYLNGNFDFLFKSQRICGFEAQINSYMELAKYFYKVLKKKDNFKLMCDTEVRTLLAVVLF